MIDKLIEKIQKLHAPVVVGFDPDLAFIPDFIQRRAFSQYGETPEGAAQAIWTFNKAIIDAVCDLVPAVKPQSAMYEQFGISGEIIFDRTIRYCHEKGLIVIGDVKRGDIGNTSAAYARGHLGPVQIGTSQFNGFDEDFVTVNPYMGSDSVLPFTETAEKSGKGIFVLVNTSNPSSADFQDRLVDGRPLFELVADKVNEWGSGSIGQYGFSEVGAVVGATWPKQAARARELMPHTFFLVPGYGAQGATAQDLKPNFNEDGLGAIVNSSRGIIAAYKKEKYAKYGEQNFADASRAAVLDMIEDINSVL